MVEFILECDLVHYGYLPPDHNPHAVACIICGRIERVVGTDQVSPQIFNIPDVINENLIRNCITELVIILVFAHALDKNRLIVQNDAPVFIPFQASKTKGSNNLINDIIFPVKQL